ncbi:MAG: HlyD family type I secretion periplasmic adaptor subunit [Magnetococcales bacterium]|nr:HlyD family type I secretion periplasmic adaptor subunit [Magnetococcales bacterium]
MSDTNNQQEELDDLQISAGNHLFLFVTFIGFFAFIIWSTIGRLDIVSNATGEVIPASQIKEIQHLEGGIVNKIMVKEGDRVVAGQPLVSLESVGAQSDLVDLKIRRVNAQLKIIRLKAELANLPELVYSKELQEQFPNLVDRSIALFVSRQKRRNSQLNAQKEVILQRKHEIAGTLARLKSNRTVSALFREQIRISKKLLSQDLSNRMQHITLLIDESKLQGQISEDKEALRRIKSTIQEAQEKEKTIINAFQEEAQKELIESVSEEEKLAQHLVKFEDSFKRTVLFAPVDGVIKTLHVVTVGGVVPPGGTVIDLVPGKDQLIIEAELQTEDIGFVRLDQNVTIRLASANAARLGIIEGKVTSISPDTYINQDGMAYYKLQVSTEQYYFEHLGTKYPLVPGMQVTCGIITGDRTVLNFFLEPLLGSAVTALQER